MEENYYKSELTSADIAPENIAYFEDLKATQKAIDKKIKIGIAAIVVYILTLIYSIYSNFSNPDLTNIKYFNIGYCVLVIILMIVSIVVTMERPQKGINMALIILISLHFLFVLASPKNIIKGAFQKIALIGFLLSARDAANKKDNIDFELESLRKK
jgi:hypothetical protein